MIGKLKRYRERIGMGSFHVLSPLDERDFILPLPQTELVKDQFSFDKNFEVLDQGPDGFCTAFAAQAMCWRNAPNTPKYIKDFYGDELALAAARQQFDKVDDQSTLDLFRSAIWAQKGYHMRTALWSLNKGLRFQQFEMKIDAYYRARPKTPEELCLFLQHYGSMLIGVAYARDGVKPTGQFTRGTGRIEFGHAINLVGYDLVKRRFYFVNSWGRKWGLSGTGWISFDDFGIIKEVWYAKGADIDFYAPDPNPETRSHQLRPNRFAR